MARSAEITHKIMAAIPSKNTHPEILLRHELWRRGLRYRVAPQKMKGKPDIVFSRAKVVVFCDGDFWHGHNWALRGYGCLEDDLKHYSPFWKNKIEKNVERDMNVNEHYKGEGWTVIRIWESEINTNLKESADTVEYAYRNAMRNK